MTIKIVEVKKVKDFDYEINKGTAQANMLSGTNYWCNVVVNNEQQVAEITTFTKNIKVIAGATLTENENVGKITFEEKYTKGGSLFIAYKVKAKKKEWNNNSNYKQNKKNTNVSYTIDEIKNLYTHLWNFLLNKIPDSNSETFQKHLSTLLISATQHGVKVEQTKTFDEVEHQPSIDESDSMFDENDDDVPF